MAANDVKNKSVSIYIDDQPAIEAYNRLIPKAEAYNKKIDEGTKKAQLLQKGIQRSLDAGGKPETLQKKLANVNKELDNNRKSLEKVTTQQKALQQQLNSGTGPSLRQQEQLVRKLLNEYKNLGHNTDEAKKKLAEYANAGKALDQMKARLQEVSNVQKENGGGFAKIFGRVAEYTGAYAIISKGTELIKSFFSDSIEEAQQAEEATDGLRLSLENAGRADLLEPLLEQADELAKKFTRLDNDDITAVFTKLVDYGKLTQAQIQQLTPVIIDYAAKAKLSLTDATTQITQALEGNSKALKKTYGIDMGQAKTFVERFGLVVNGLGDKVRGSEAAFESTSKGGMERFKQKIRDVQEDVGRFFLRIVDGPKSADKAFDEAKSHVDNYSKTVNSLLGRYDELKSKTTLNKAEQGELHAIINKIVELVPQAATEFDKYGNALDINKDKVKGFLKEQSEFLQLKEADAISDLVKKSTNAAKTIEQNSKGLNEANRLLENLNKDKAFLDPNVYEKRANEFTTSITTLRTEIAKNQDALINYTDLLIDKYKAGGKLQKTVIDFRNEALKAKFGEQQLNNNAPDANKVVGTGNGETPDEKAARLAKEKEEKEERERKAKELARQREEERKKILEDQKRLHEELFKLQVEFSGLQQSEYSKELQSTFDKYEKLKELAHGNKKDLAQIEIGFNEAIAAVNKKFADKALEDLKKLDEEKRKLREKELQDQLQKGFKFLDNVATDVTKSADRNNQLRKAENEYNLQKLSGKKHYDEEKRQLNEEEDLAVQAAIKNGDSVEAVHKEYQKRREDLELTHTQKLIATIQDYANQVLSIFSTINQIQSSRENAELNRIQQRATTEKASYQRLLNNKIISKQQYDRKVAELDAQADRKKEAIEKQQFERNKKIQIAQALVNGAMGITSVIAARPGAADVFSLGVARAIQIGLTIASTAAAVATIAKSKYEGSSAKFGKGGSLTGPLHKDGGMPVINPRTGKKEAEVEGGEVILSRKTVGNNESLVNALLYNSMHRDGATIDPWFKNRTYKAIDFSGISRSIQNVRHYASGGTFQASSTASSDGSAPVQVIMPEGFEALPDVLNALITQLRTPQKNYVVWQDIKDKQVTEAAQKADVTFGKK